MIFTEPKSELQVRLHIAEMKDCPFEAWQLIQAKEILKWVRDNSTSRRRKHLV